MASSKSVAAFLMVFAFVSTNAVALGGLDLGGLLGPGTSTPTPVKKGDAKCPDLKVCVGIAKSLVNLQIGSRDTECCQLIAGLVDLNARACVCTNLLNTNNGLFNAVGTALGLVEGLLGGLTGPILDQQIAAIINGCDLKAPKYNCRPRP